MTDTLNKKPTLGQLFVATLEETKGDKDKLFRLLSAALEKTRSNPDKITDNEALVSFKARLAEYNANKGRELNPEDYVYMAAERYKKAGHGGIAQFKNDFKKFIETGSLNRTNMNMNAKTTRAQATYGGY